MRSAIKAQAHGDPVCKSDSVTLSVVKEPVLRKVCYDLKKELVPIIPTGGVALHVGEGKALAGERPVGVFAGGAEEGVAFGFETGDSIFGRFSKHVSENDDAVAEATHAAGAESLDTPGKWSEQLEHGSNAVAVRLLSFLKNGSKSAVEIADALGIKSRPFLTNYYLVPLMAKGLIRQTIPNKPKSRFQRYVLF